MASKKVMNSYLVQKLRMQQRQRLSNAKHNPAEFVKRHMSRLVDPTVAAADLKAMLSRAEKGLGGDEEPTQPKVYSFTAKGDPMLVVRDEAGHVIAEKHYHGPATVVFFDEKGSLNHIDFVGVCDGMGGNQQSPLADYVGEHARLFVQSGRWKFRDGRKKQMAEVSDKQWQSERCEDWRPDLTWLRPFAEGKTFVLHRYQPRIIEGPRFGTIWSMAIAPELFQLDFDRSRANEWVNAMLVVVGSTQQLGLKKDAEELLCYAIMYGMAMTGGGSRQLAAISKGRTSSAALHLTSAKPTQNQWELELPAVEMVSD